MEWSVLGNGQLRCGCRLDHYCSSPGGVSSGGITARYSTRFCGSCVPRRRGAICLSATVHTQTMATRRCQPPVHDSRKACSSDHGEKQPRHRQHIVGNWLLPSPPHLRGQGHGSALDAAGGTAILRNHGSVPAGQLSAWVLDEHCPGFLKPACSCSRRVAHE